MIRRLDGAFKSRGFCAQKGEPSQVWTRRRVYICWLSEPHVEMTPHVTWWRSMSDYADWSDE